MTYDLLNTTSNSDMKSQQEQDVQRRKKTNMIGPLWNFAQIFLFSRGLSQQTLVILRLFLLWNHEVTFMVLFWYLNIDLIATNIYEPHTITSYSGDPHKVHIWVVCAFLIWRLFAIVSPVNTPTSSTSFGVTCRCSLGHSSSRAALCFQSVFGLLTAENRHLRSHQAPSLLLSRGLPGSWKSLSDLFCFLKNIHDITDAFFIQKW